MFIYDYDPITTELAFKTTNPLPPTATFSNLIIRDDLNLLQGTCNIQDSLQINDGMTITVSAGATLGIV